MADDIETSTWVPPEYDVSSALYCLSTSALASGPGYTANFARHVKWYDSSPSARNRALATNAWMCVLQVPRWLHRTCSVRESVIPVLEFVRTSTGLSYILVLNDRL